jgi:hypothetical protein
LIDHHHLARALYEEGLKSVFITVVADLSRLTADHFWNMMDFHGWAHPYDGEGRRRPFSELPTTVKTMEDDPDRSLAGELRNIGGFAKDSTPFSEFLSADFLRPSDQRKSDQGRFQSCSGGGALFLENRKRGLFPRVVRPARIRPGASCGCESQKGQAGIGVRRNSGRRHPRIGSVP